MKVISRFQLRKKFKSILKNRCPRCCKGKFWPYSPFYNLLFNGGKLFDACSHCGLKYYKEIGFWYGAMYISYSLNVFEFLIMWAITSLFIPENWSTWVQVGIICGIFLLLVPINFFYARLIWINIFVNYDHQAAEQPSKNIVPQMKSET